MGHIMSPGICKANLRFNHRHCRLALRRLLTVIGLPQVNLWLSCKEFSFFLPHIIFKLFFSLLWFFFCPSLKKKKKKRRGYGKETETETVYGTLPPGPPWNGNKLIVKLSLHFKFFLESSLICT